MDWVEVSAGPNGRGVLRKIRVEEGWLYLFQNDLGMPAMAAFAVEPAPVQPDDV